MSTEGLSKGTKNLKFMNRALVATPISVETSSTSLLSFPFIRSPATPLHSPHTGRNMYGYIEPPPPEITPNDPTPSKKSSQKRKSTDQITQVRRPAPSPVLPPSLATATTTTAQFQKPTGFDDLKLFPGGNSASIKSQRDQSKRGNGERRTEAAKGKGKGENIAHAKGKGKKGKGKGALLQEDEPVWDEQGVEREWDSGKILSDEDEDDSSFDESSLLPSKPTTTTAAPESSDDESSPEQPNEEDAAIRDEEMSFDQGEEESIAPTTTTNSAKKLAKKNRKARREAARTPEQKKGKKGPKNSRNQ